MQNHLLEGEIPAFTDSIASNKVLVSRTIADRLSLKVGDNLYTYYLENNIRARRLTVSGIYQTNFLPMTICFDNGFIYSRSSE